MLSVISQVGYEEGGVYVALPLPCEGREAVSDRVRWRREIYTPTKYQQI